MRSRSDSDDGANAVEFALVLPLLVTLIFGAITAGLALNTRQQLDHAGREGARFGATLPDAADASATPCTSPDRSWYECVRDHTEAASVGSIDTSGGVGGICVSYIDESDDATSRFYGVIETDAGTTTSTDPCIEEDPSLDGTSSSRVHVKVVAPSRLDAVFVQRDLLLTSRSISRYEEGP